MKQNNFVYRKHVSKIVKEVERIDKTTKRNTAYRRAGVVREPLDIIEMGGIMNYVKRIMDTKRAIEK